MNLDTDRLRSHFRAEVESIEKRRSALQVEINDLDDRLRGVETRMEALKAIEESVRRMNPDSDPADAVDASFQKAATERSQSEHGKATAGDRGPGVRASSDEPAKGGEDSEIANSFLDNNGLIPSFLRRHL